MSNVEAFKEMYRCCKEMDVEDTVDLALNAETQEEQEFVEVITNYILQTRQKEVIAQGKF
ncbi:MAG: hypothetical protein IJ429_04985 [Lachnospiraceae bacterium]|nr:hypothetical protein [Lachnospiraceae bacterium]